MAVALPQGCVQRPMFRVDDSPPPMPPLILFAWRRMPPRAYVRQRRRTTGRFSPRMRASGSLVRERPSKRRLRAHSSAGNLASRQYRSLSVDGLTARMPVGACWQRCDGEAEALCGQNVYVAPSRKNRPTAPSC